MILIFLNKLNSRKEYIFRHFFKRLIEVEYEFTSQISEFIAHDGPKISYGIKPLGDEFFIWSYGLLDEVGVDDHEIEISQWQELPIFFKAPERSELPFDIFSAAFYLITRYEEYLPQVKDNMGRFSASSSVAYQHDFLSVPVVDLWVQRFEKLLQERFEITLSRKRNTNITAAIETATVFKYKYRAVVPLIKYLYNHLKVMKLRKVLRQLAVHLRILKDPYDVYDILLRVYKEAMAQLPYESQKGRDMLFFFHLGDYNDTDNGVSYTSRRYQELIKHIGDYVNLGLRFSYANADDKIHTEKHRYEEITHRSLVKTMTAHSKISMPGHYKKLVDIDTIEDYSMGYTAVPGYRASTAHSFYFYDLDYEVQTPLRIYPYALHYNSIENFMLHGQQTIMGNLYRYAHKTNGNFIVLFNNEQLDLKRRSHVYTMLKKMLTYEA